MGLCVCVCGGGGDTDLYPIDLQLPSGQWGWEGTREGICVCVGGG